MRCRIESADQSAIKHAALLSVIAGFCLWGCSFEPEVLARGTAVLPEDGYDVVRFALPRGHGAQVQLVLIDGSPIDVYVFDEANMNRWITRTTTALSVAGDDLQCMSGLELAGFSAHYTSEWCTLPAARYALILESTDYGGTMPPMNMKDDRAVVEYTISSKWPPR